MMGDMKKKHTRPWSDIAKLANGRFLENVLFVGALVSISWSIYFSLVTISIPYQLEFHEGTALVITDLLTEGKNPFNFEHQPLAMTNYGIGYSIAVLPFARLFGSTLLIHRAVTFVFIFFSGLLGGMVVYRSGKNKSLALPCMAFIMIGLVARGGIGAFPSGMGTFLFLAAIYLPCMRSFDHPSLVASILLSLAAFYTKPYFVLSSGIVASYLFLFVSKKSGILYGLIFLIGLLISALGVGRIFPLYFTNTFLGNVANTSMTAYQMFRQLIELFSNFYPVILLLLFLAMAPHFHNGPRNIPDFQLGTMADLRKWDLPVFEFRMGFLLHCFMCSLLAFVFILGPHVGNYMSYAYQLLVPTFFCWLFCDVNFDKRWMALVTAVLVTNLYLWAREYESPQMLDQKDSREWARLFDHVHSAEVILNSPMVASEIVAMGMTPVDAGQTRFFYSVAPFSDNVFIGTSYDAFRADGLNYVRLIDRMIEKQRFDLILTFKGKASFYHERLVFQYYSVVEEIQIDTPQVEESWTILVWRPLAE